MAFESDHRDKSKLRDRRILHRAHLVTSLGGRFVGLRYPVICVWGSTFFPSPVTLVTGATDAVQDGRHAGFTVAFCLFFYSFIIVLSQN